jgi:thioredoxin-related protein
MNLKRLFKDFISAMLVSTSFVWLISTTTVIAFSLMAQSQIVFAKQLPSYNVAWKEPVNGSVSALFEQARKTNRPVFLYWGAVWCPPCNQVKATVFNRREFAQASKAFIPIYIDGDGVGAQKLANQFNVRAYPTMVLFKPDGTEITRLPGEVDPTRYLQVLNLGLKNSRSIKSLVETARNTPAKLTPEDWQLLAFYSWDLDDSQVVPAKEKAALLTQLAAVATDPTSQRRLALKALASDGKASTPSLVTTLLQVLNNPQQSRELSDLIVYSAQELAVGAKSINSNPSALSSLQAAYVKQLERLSQDASLNWNERLTAHAALLDVEKALSAQPVGAQAPNDQAKAPVTLNPAWIAAAKLLVTQADAAVKTSTERQALIPTAGSLLSRAGLHKEADDLVRNELPRAIAPYYHMLVLASSARKQGNNSSAIEWSQKAYESAQGPATKIQWGGGYLRTLIDLSPQDVTRIEQTAISLIQNFEPVPATFYERNSRSLGRVAQSLHKWNANGEHAAVLMRLQGELSKICRRLPAGDPGRINCEGSLAPPKAS